MLLKEFKKQLSDLGSEHENLDMTRVDVDWRHKSLNIKVHEEGDNKYVIIEGSYSEPVNTSERDDKNLFERIGFKHWRKNDKTK